MIRVIVCDDHAIVRGGLRELFSDEHDMQTVGEAANGTELLALLRIQDCDALVLDISLPGRDGLDILKEIRGLHRNIGVLVLTMHPEEQYAVRALRAGASGYLSKDCAPDELARAVRRIAAGGKYVSESLAARLAGLLGPNAAQAPHDALSDREFEVLRGIASGKTVGEIAEALFLSPNTISTYRARLLQKLSLRNNAELTHYALSRHLLD